MFSDDLQTAEYTSAGCCPCSGDVDLPAWDGPTWEEPTWDEPTWDEPTWDESTTWTEVPAATAATTATTEVGAAWGEGLDTAASAAWGGPAEPAPTEYPSVAYIGGTDPWHEGAIELPTVATIGGNDPFQPAFEYPTVAYVGGPTPMSAAAIDVADATEAFSQLSLPEMKAAMWGGTPELWDTPTVPLYGHTPIHTVVNSQLTLDALRNLARNGVVVPFV